MNEFRGMAQPACEFIDRFLILTMIDRQARIAQNSCQFGKHFVGDEQPVILRKHRPQKLVRKSMRVDKGAYENVAVENNPHGIGV
jgi:hypothetical protein